MQENTIQTPPQDVPRVDAIEWALQELAFLQQSTTNITAVWVMACKTQNPYKTGRGPSKADVETYLQACTEDRVPDRSLYRHPRV